jgi:hypothetical protein
MTTGKECEKMKKNCGWKKRRNENGKKILYVIVTAMLFRDTKKERKDFYLIILACGIVESQLYVYDILHSLYDYFSCFKEYRCILVL